MKIKRMTKNNWAKKYLQSQSGNSLVEVIVVVAIVAIISVPMTMFMFDMMKSAIRIEEEVLLRDEADIILADFINYVFVADDVIGYPESGEPQTGVKDTEVTITTFDGDQRRLGFENGNAFIQGGADKTYLNSEGYKVDMNKSSIKVDEVNKIVHIVLVMKSDKMDRVLELESSIGYL
ncbi:prepilin-type N-terminal cleavage/methylation domain-containing protein [Massilibacterium senegalense]|uniref:prepilin-type N-terminal cleavage/methylation domain-containing protein n=1 Tax=Massilibacterium senegalense TaxID=1632858 RepID=UPI0007807C9B|nr:prepilin-type N-terminal cleavage/methylation domain-containing protein [Massilibacterium senegalense]